MEDSEPISEGSENLLDMITGLISRIQFKFLGIMFLVFLFVSSDLFILGALDKVPNAVEFKSPTTYGVILQGVALVLIMFVMDPLIGQKII